MLSSNLLAVLFILSASFMDELRKSADFWKEKLKAAKVTALRELPLAGAVVVRHLACEFDVHGEPARTRVHMDLSANQIFFTLTHYKHVHATLHGQIDGVFLGNLAEELDRVFDRTEESFALTFQQW